MSTNRIIRSWGLAALLLLAVANCTKTEEETRWPAATLHAPAEALQGLAVTLALDLAPGTEALVEASFDFDGNGTADTVLFSPPTGTWTVEHAFAAPGWPVVKGRVVDATGRAVVASQRVTVTRGRPPTVQIVAPATAVDSATVRFVVRLGGYPLAGFTYAAEGDSCVWSGLDSVTQGDTVRVYTATLTEEGASERLTLSARATDALGQTGTASASLYLVGRILGLRVLPENGHAPLACTLRLIHRPYGFYDGARLAWRTDSTWDTTYVPDRDTLFVPLRFDSVGTALIRAELFAGEDTLRLADTVRVW